MTSRGTPARRWNLREVQSRQQSPQHAQRATPQRAQETCRPKERWGGGRIPANGAYFQEAPGLCADSRTGSGGGGRGRSRDPCRRSPASDTDSPSCRHAKHLSERNHTAVIRWEKKLKKLKLCISLHHDITNLLSQLQDM